MSFSILVKKGIASSGFLGGFSGSVSVSSRFTNEAFKNASLLVISFDEKSFFMLCFELIELFRASSLRDLRI